jgi:hypothetical protein
MNRGNTAEKLNPLSDTIPPKPLRRSTVGKKRIVEVEIAIKTLIISMLIENLSVSDIIRNLHRKGFACCRNTVERVARESKPLILEKQKEVVDSVVQSETEQYKTYVHNLLKIIGICSQKLVEPSRIESANPLQIATILGICTDKFNLANGLSTDNINVQYKDKQAMLDFIKGRAQGIVGQASAIINAPGTVSLPLSTPVTAKSAPVKCIDTIESVPGKVADAPVPLVAKRGRGRPRKYT